MRRLEGISQSWRAYSCHDKYGGACWALARRLTEALVTDAKIIETHVDKRPTNYSSSSVTAYIHCKYKYSRLLFLKH